MSKIRKIIPWATVFSIMTVIFCFSAQPASESTQTSGFVVNILLRIFYGDIDKKVDLGLLTESDKAEIIMNMQFFVRKAAHFSIYALLGICTYIAFRSSGFKYSRIIAPLICLAYAVSDEIHQYFVPGRSCEFRDVLIDFSGAVTGTLLILIITALRRKKHDKHQRL